MKEKCENCKFFAKSDKMINGSYKCNFHLFTTNPEDVCYKIQFSYIK